MAIIDLSSGEKTDEEPIQLAQDQPQPAPKQRSGGIIDLNTGEFTSEQPQATKPPEVADTSKEDLLRSLSGTSVADIASETVGAPINQLIGSLAGKSIGGLETLVKAPFVGTEEAIESGQETERAVAGAFSPQTELGQQSTNVVFNALAQANKIPAGWGAIAELIETGGDVEAASQVIDSVMTKGLPKHMADLNFEAYDSPLLATMTSVIPEIASLFFPVKGSIQRGRVNKARKDLGMIDQIEQGKSGREIAEYKLQNRDKWNTPTEAEVSVLAEKLNTDKVFARQMAETMPVLHKKKTFDQAIKQEWDQSLLGLIQASSKKDVGVMQNMLTIYGDAMDNMALKADRRPIYEAGQAISDRAKYLLKKKNEAGKRVGAAAQSLRGVEVDYIPAVDKFVTSLLNDGVVINNGRPITNVRQYRNMDFRNSPYDGSKASEDIIRKQIKRMTEKDFALDGFNLHTTKQNLPHQITTAKKTEGGLVNKAELLLNDLRRDINNVLRNSSDDYRQANDDFQVAITPLNEINENMPKNAQISWEGINPDNAGLQVRKVLTNYGNGGDLGKAIKSLDRVSRELGGNFDSDAIKQAFFAIGLDKRLGAFADASLQGVTESAATSAIGSIPTSTLDAGVKALSGVMRKTKRVDNERAIKAMHNYLKESKQGK